jgi:hypothetical protein
MRHWINKIRSEPEVLTDLHQVEAEQLLADFPGLLRDVEGFVAGSFTSCLAAWETMLENSNRKSSKKVLSWLRAGFKPRFVGTDGAKESKRKIVVGMLRRVVPLGDIPKMLSGKFPHPVQFTNHQSFYEHYEFAMGEVKNLALWGAAQLMLEGDEQPVVINPLGVALTAGKRRLICNNRYPNLFLEALLFRYERLRDVLAFTKEGGFMSTWDLKAGYYHVLIHPRFRKYFGFRVGDLVFQFNIVFFGFAEACYVFTKIVQEPALELRAAGIPVSSYVDDGFTSAEQKLKCLRQALLAIVQQAILGAFHGLPKCQIEPLHWLKWLGFMLDSTKQNFEVGGSKMEKVKKTLRSVLAKSKVTARDLAQAAGKIISLSPAVAPAALYSRSFFQAMKGRETGDSVFPNPTAVTETLEFWLTRLDSFNGRAWWPRPVQIEAVVDASGVGYGGLIQIPGLDSVPFTGTFSPGQAAASSTLREVLGYVAAVEVVAGSFPDSLRGSSVLVTGDIQGAVSCINILRSPVLEINQALRRLFDLCVATQCDVQAQWVPRELIDEADAVSRSPDASDWGIAPSLYRQICERFGVKATMDLFASDSHHVTDKFVSQNYVPGCTAVQAFVHDWRRLVGTELAWNFPPIRRVSSTISLLEQHKVSGLLVIPQSRASNEAIQVYRLKGATVSLPFTIPRSADSCLPSLRVPDNSLNPAFLGLQVLYIQWT